ncbi:type II toxin-antitoxin system RelE/ParE family toxin [Beijerinckia sp. L45]|uniref:type II toxin-antitoxin system RelE/ParE family toxin n=1 Tax=Beijerinckia sp. L45 TaxID=1641855 RepID=UPI00131B15DE|nr:type II toxin-antitoxin system RelE/ParE family toxin [Beijerinckia sp. L45]
MRRIRFTTPAAIELAAILDYISDRNPAGAQNVQQRIQQVIEHVALWPNAGAASRNRPGMRRVHAVPYPYAINYRFSDDEIVIYDVWHTRRDR